MAHSLRTASKTTQSVAVYMLSVRSTPVPCLGIKFVLPSLDLSLGLENSGAVFTLHDGPPYANGALHMGHALNKVLKDVINKYQVLRGRRVRFVPGWDCHGLPIELKVLQSMDQEQRQALTPIKLRKKAAAYARKQVEGQMKGFQRWGIWADWDHPYLTLQKEYEAV